jgi:hypothetical protein
MRRVLVVLGMSTLISGQALASPALTSSPTIMRASPSSKARVIQAIPNNVQIDLNYCDKAWCYVSWRNLLGYVSAKSVVALPEAPPPGVVYGPPAVVVAPYYGWGWDYGWGWGFGPGPGYGGPGPGFGGPGRGFRR